MGTGIVPAEAGTEISDENAEDGEAAEDIHEFFAFMGLDGHDGVGHNGGFCGSVMGVVVNRQALWK